MICSTMNVAQNIYFLSQSTLSLVHCSLLGGTVAALVRLLNKNK